ncbi:hypothetical protein YGS_C1P2657 [Sphingobium sp. YG1]|jgi:hypothetical protein|nr:hypothetical protein YGS_C1P2657 [Sphingobium sp. YG1]
MPCVVAEWLRNMRRQGSIIDGTVDQAPFGPMAAKPGPLNKDHGAIVIEPPP